MGNRSDIALNVSTSRRRTFQYFVAFAEKDSRPVSGLLDLLRLHFKASKANDYLEWECHRLLAGERWHDRIQEAIVACDFSLLCLSPAFLASDYVKEHEIPPLLQQGRIIPIGLKPYDGNLHQCLSLDERQVFRLRTTSGRLYWYSELRGSDREAFALDLFRQIEERLWDAPVSKEVFVR
jgi:hypothetical protein